MVDDQPTAAARSIDAIKPRLIVGLGNPGASYQDTRHNIGFMVVDQLAAQLGSSFSSERRWNSLVGKFAGGWLLKPLTFMNASGRAVSQVSHFYKVSAAEVLVIYDDLDLPLGRLRLRPGGSAGGHNGMCSIIGSLGTQTFPRLRIGIGHAEGGRPDGGRVVGHVLGRFSEDERAVLPAALSRACDAVLTCLRQGLGAAMNQFNRNES